MHYVNRSLLNILYIIHPSGNFSWNISWPMFFMILKGLYLFWSSFFEGCFNWIFLASSYMLSSCFSPYVFCFFLLNCFFIASFAISINIFATSQLFFSSSRKVSSFDNSVFIIRSLFYRCCPKLSLNRVYPVAKCFLLLYWNSAVDNYSV